MSLRSRTALTSAPRRSVPAASARGSVGATAPMLPAPSVSTTSSALSICASTAGSSLKSSMKIGSTAPRTRTARASDLPSAPASGVSPAE